MRRRCFPNRRVYKFFVTLVVMSRLQVVISPLVLYDVLIHTYSDRDHFMENNSSGEPETFRVCSKTESGLVEALDNYAYKHDFKFKLDSDERKSVESRSKNFPIFFARTNPVFQYATYSATVKCICEREVAKINSEGRISFE